MFGYLFLLSVKERKESPKKKRKLNPHLANPRSPEAIEKRLDKLVHDIRSRYHEPILKAPKSGNLSGDVLIVAHGHILRAFAMRWIGHELTEGVALLLEGNKSKGKPPFPVFSALFFLTVNNPSANPSPSLSPQPAASGP